MAIIDLERFVQRQEPVSIRFPDASTCGRALGPIVFLAILLGPTPAGLTDAAQRVLAVAGLMVVWWITEAFPIPMTSLLPLILFPWLGVLSTRDAAAPYADKNIFLFLGGFLIALAMQRWNLHRRIALRLILIIGSSPLRIIGGFMVATGFLSMWISNTATTMMMLPIGLAVSSHMGIERKRIGAPLMLAIAYAASAGGLATLVGTPPNLVLKGGMEKLYPSAPELSFVQWMTMGIPITLIMGFAIFFIIVMLYGLHKLPQNAGSSRESLRGELTRLGPLNRGERWTLLVFIMTAVAWITRQGIDFGTFRIPGWGDVIPGHLADDSTVAMTGGLLLFILPVNTKERRFVLEWSDTSGIPFGVLFLFGGGFCLAHGFRSSGLSEWLTSHLDVLANAPHLVAVLTIALTTTFLTELTSNTATASLLVPLLGSLAVALRIHPLLLLLPATFSASCAFMLPVATPPNAVVFGSGLLSIREMARTGLILNLIGVIVVTATVLILGPIALGVDFTTLPSWVAG